MSSNPDTVILYTTSDSDGEGSTSSTAVSPLVSPTPELPLLASDDDTEPFEEEETAPTSHVHPTIPTDIPSPTTTTTTHSEPRLMFPRDKTVQGPRKRVRIATSTYRSLPSPTVPTPPPPAIPTTTPIPTSLLPLRKRARLTTPDSPITETDDLSPPPEYHVGESSRAAAIRELTTLTFDVQREAQQEQVDRLGYRVDEIITTRLETVEEQVEDLIQGRVSIDVSYHGLEARQLRHQEEIELLRDELPEIRDRAQATQETQWEQVDQLTLLRERVVVLERRDASSQLRLEHLEETVVAMDREIRRLRGEPGPSRAPGGA
jgi:hypothetical protein